MNLIEDLKKTGEARLNERGYYFDFETKRNSTLPRYANYLNSVLWPNIADVLDYYGQKIRKMSRPWFQQYTQGTMFGWHHHNFSWSIIYYLELPEPAEATEFHNYGIFPVKEGDVIFFPSFLIHRAPKITSNKRKTIFSCNIDTEVDREYMDANFS